jgi:hypothetical protein
MCQDGGAERDSRSSEPGKQRCLRIVHATRLLPGFLACAFPECVLCVESAELVEIFDFKSASIRANLPAFPPRLNSLSFSTTDDSDYTSAVVFRLVR